MKSLSLSIPYVIAMIGQPGTGKSYFAKQFTDNFHMPAVSEEYFRNYARRTDDGTTMAADVLHELMKIKQAILFEGDLDKKSERDSLVRFCHQRGYKVLFVWVQTEPEVARQRAQKSMTAREYKQRALAFEPPTNKEQYVVISGRHTQATQARTVLKHLVESRQRKTPAAATQRSGEPVSVRRKLG